MRMVRKAVQDNTSAEPNATAVEGVMPRPLWPAAVILLALTASLAWSVFLSLVVLRLFGLL
jgi:hypothetical protein